jgi:hypothetical protein
MSRFMQAAHEVVALYNILGWPFQTNQETQANG